jgi:hypothetical protein
MTISMKVEWNARLSAYPTNNLDTINTYGIMGPVELRRLEIFFQDQKIKSAKNKKNESGGAP